MWAEFQRLIEDKFIPASIAVNRVVKRIFGPKRNGLTGGWRKLHNEELRMKNGVF
jgi:hypothetical protein